MENARQIEIIHACLDYLDTLEDGEELSTWDVLDHVYGYQGYKDVYRFNGFTLTENEFRELDANFKEEAHRQGYFLDDSTYQDVIGAFPFSLTFVVKK